jgi:hypothetical protein
LHSCSLAISCTLSLSPQPDLAHLWPDLGHLTREKALTVVVDVVVLLERGLDERHGGRSEFCDEAGVAEVEAKGSRAKRGQTFREKVSALADRPGMNVVRQIDVIHPIRSRALYCK